ncbi:hypothetical protein E3N88_23600 [Mikania micrantha]|uniref:RNase H type-1 domain-containing protein n=1 Tax=Mikania micrantha TaxID=192012 RepID=A0A5N6NEV1_9ASTR|nr:hypothetical protein E3N88_23600 [Mikania micrantha]
MLEDIEETFFTLKQINMKLNPAKCSFGLEEGKFLGHLVCIKDIKANPEKVQAIMEMISPKTVKEVQRLNGKIASLHRFLSKSAEKSLPFFKVLKTCNAKTGFQWTEEAEKAFHEMKAYITSLPTLVVSKAGQELVMYISAGEEVVSAVLLADQGGVRLRRYFQAHPIKILTQTPLKEALQRPENSGRLAKWAVELGEHTITYAPRASIKGQVLADFLVETPVKVDLVDMETQNVTPEDQEKDEWLLYTDGASSAEGSGAGLILVDPSGVEVTYALRLKFPSTNNEAEYEAFLAGLRIAKRMGVRMLKAHVDSLLVANQVNGDYIAKEPSMKQYKDSGVNLLQQFEKYKVVQVARSQNKRADALSKLASLIFAHLTKKVLMEVLDKPSTTQTEVHDVIQEEGETWMTPIYEYLSKGILPPEIEEADLVKISMPSDSNKENVKCKDQLRKVSNYSKAQVT